MTLPELHDLHEFAARWRSGIPSPICEGPVTTEVERALESLEHALRELAEKRLVVGLLGGTGVGKSTLLNALANAAISQPGDRRPTTDRVIGYRHEDFPLPAWLDLADLADPPPPHRIEALRGVILLDLPDVDSRAREHRARVHRVLPRLDLLLVVTSVDKYGDDALYREIASFPQAPRNAIFVLNAIDRLAPADLERVRLDFLEKLQRFGGLQQPTIIALSALRARTEPARAGDFAELQSRLDRLGGDRERQAVLAANAEIRLAATLDTIDAALPAVAVEAWLEALSAVPSKFPAPPVSVVQALRSELAARLGPWATARALQASSFPIRLVHFFLRRFGRAAPGRDFADPFANGQDLAGGFAEDLLRRPMRLARHATRAALRTEETRLQIALPEEREDDEAELHTFRARWSQKLHERTPRWGWKLRQHVPPGLVAATWLGWALARFVPEPGSSDGWVGSLARGFVTVLQSLSPATLLFVGGLLVVYYALVYPYFLYRLEARIEGLAKESADGYLAAWRTIFERTWGTPLAAEIDRVRDWWRGFERARRELGRHRVGSRARSTA
ncbi:MAG: GTPase [Planctomycetota bacterium]